MSKSRPNFPGSNSIQRLNPQTAAAVLLPARSANGAIDATGCRCTVALAVAIYTAALGGSALLHVKTPILEGVWPCLIAAAFLCFCGGTFFPQASRIILTMIEGTLIIVALGLSLACLSYLSPILEFPFRDREMISIDQYLGLDWLAIMHVVDQQPFLLTVLNAAYATFTAQLIGTAFLLVVTQRTRDLDRFFVTFVCASIIAEFASLLVPTLGPMATLARDSNFAHLPTIGRITGQIVVELRNGTLRTIDLQAIDGIISFPSLHAAVAVIVPYTLRWNKALFWPILGLDSVMFVSAVPSGNHYLSDVVGGVVVAGLAILCGKGLHEFSKSRYPTANPASLKNAHQATA